MLCVISFVEKDVPLMQKHTETKIVLYYKMSTCWKHLLSLAVAMRARLLSRSFANSAVYESSWAGSVSSVEPESYATANKPQP